MKILVFDLPAEHGGALTILHQFYELAVRERNKNWIFVVSTPELKDHDHIQVLRFPWVKKSWLHRYYFDQLVAPKIAKRIGADEIISLQNVTIPRVHIKQTLYLHQSLPFAKKRYAVTENFSFWAYQNIIKKMIVRSVRKADEVIVQTKWMKKTVIESADIEGGKIIVKQPELSVKVEKHYESGGTDVPQFFYPAGGMPYKNHEIIIRACQHLKEIGVCDYRVFFTLSGDENFIIKKQYEIVKINMLPISYIGTIEIDQVYRYYSQSILIFPSYIETFGLPLLEAKMHNAPIIASDCEFAREVLENYKKAFYIDPDDHIQLAEIMATIVEN